jgi:predicted kinase
MPEIVIADPSLVVLVGAAGSGKSTFAARHFAPGEIVSSDRFRELIAGDAADQRATRPAFGRLHRELTRRLAAGLLTVVDATSIEPAARRALLRRARTAGVPATAIVLDLPEAVVLARSAGRPERTVDNEVVRRHLARLRSQVDDPMGPIPLEGFDAVVIIRDPDDLDSVVIRRIAAQVG